MNITEITNDVYRISLYVPEIDLQFNHFLVRDDEPLLYHTGMNQMFPGVYDAIGKIIDPAKPRWIGFSHFESDECGSLNQWLEASPHAEAVCSQVGAFVSVNDFAVRPARGLADGETFSTGRYRLRFVQTPHLPHCWEAGLLFEETEKTLFCSDLFAHNGDVAPFTESDIIERVREIMIAEQKSLFADASPCTTQTEANLKKLAALDPKTFAAMHGSSFAGDGAQILRDLGTVMREVLA